MLLAEQVALITGAATGIGRATALLFAREGASIAIADIKDEEAHETVQMIENAGGRAFYVRTDLGKVNNLEMMVKATVDHYGRLDIFFHNAGIAGPGLIDETSEEEYDQIMAINLKAAYFGAKYAVKEMRKAGGGNILFTGSGAGLRPSPISPSYSVSKAGLVMLTRCLAYSLAQDNIRVNCICPGIVKTPLWPSFLSRGPSSSPEKITQHYLDRRAIKRFGTTEEIAQAALFLSSSNASWITGVSLPVDGGGAAG